MNDKDNQMARTCTIFDSSYCQCKVILPGNLIYVHNNGKLELQTLYAPVSVAAFEPAWVK